ncbi:MAG: hypothetical protein ABSB50_16930 [Terracidiphilus sp.]
MRGEERGKKTVALAKGKRTAVRVGKALETIPARAVQVMVTKEETPPPRTVKVRIAKERISVPLVKSHERSLKVVGTERVIAKKVGKRR